MIGKEISHYRITERIGAGGMGTVYKADDLTLKRIVAVKVVKATNIDPTLSTSRFLHEAKAVSKINHPNVVTLLDIEQQGASNYLIMEYVDGPSLRALLADGPIESKRVLEITRDIARGLGAAHALGVIHRDIKPENVVLDAEGRAKILDFGVAHLVDQTSKTRRGSLIGTLPYMSPQQIQAKPVDLRADVYALGVLLYEMLTCKLPFDGKEEEALIFQILNLTPPRLEETITGLPAGLQEILTTAMAKKPDERYPSMVDMVHDIDVILAQLGSGKP
ncbi:MAG: serine/threonine-protein kinase [bacterium]|nr:serine/threonine-protein kinase [bacterium]